MKEGSRAENSGLKLGDSIVTVNNVDTSNMTLQEANNVLEQASQQDVKLGVIKWVKKFRFLFFYLNKILVVVKLFEEKSLYLGQFTHDVNHWRSMFI